MENNKLEEYVTCEICNINKKRITTSHLKTHNTTFLEYKTLYPNSKTITDEVRKTTAVTLENLVKKYGPEEGMIRWESYKNKQAYSNSFEYKNKTHGWSEKEYKSFNKSRAVTKINLVKKHGKEIGTQIWENYVNRQKHAGCSLDYFKEKYGEIEGNIKYKELNEKKRLTLGNFQIKYGIEEGEKKYKEYLYKVAKRESFSEMSQILFLQIEDMHSSKIYYGIKKTGEFCIYDKTNKKARFFDYVDTERKKCIEFNGNVYHANPKMYTENDRPNFFRKDLTSKDIWEEDNKKNELIVSRGYDLLIVWEKNFTENPQKVINECLLFLYGKPELPNS
jgi:hypothetical protein